MLVLDDVHKSYRIGAQSLHVLKGVDLQVDAGEFVAIMGSSGSGKSTLLNVLGILDRYDAGEYWLNGELMRHVSETRAADLRSRHIGFVFQSFNLLAFKTALENVALPLYYRRVGRKQRQLAAMAMLERVGLGDRADHLPAELSGGQRQRVAIARALITGPSIILADEPTGALDSTTSGQIMDLFSELHRDGSTILVVTHEQDVAARTQRVIHMRDGCIDQPQAVERHAHTG